MKKPYISILCFYTLTILCASCRGSDLSVPHHELPRIEQETPSAESQVDIGNAPPNPSDAEYTIAIPDRTSTESHFDQDYYAILGVSTDATHEEIKKAYRRLAFQHHPDKNLTDRNATDRFIKIKEAYGVLSDTLKRRSYDSLTKFSGNPLTDKGLVMENLLEYLDYETAKAFLQVNKRIGRAIKRSSKSAILTPAQKILLIKLLCGDGYTTFRDSCILGVESYEKLNVHITEEDRQLAIPKSILREVYNRFQEGNMSILLLDLYCNRYVYSRHLSYLQLDQRVRDEGNWILVVNPYSYGVEEVRMDLELYSNSVYAKDFHKITESSLSAVYMSHLAAVVKLTTRNFTEQKVRHCSSNYHEKYDFSPTFMIEMMLRDMDPDLNLKTILDKAKESGKEQEAEDYLKSIEYLKKLSANKVLNPFLEHVFRGDEGIFSRSLKSLVFCEGYDYSKRTSRNNEGPGDCTIL